MHIFLNIDNKINYFNEPIMKPSEKLCWSNDITRTNITIIRIISMKNLEYSCGATKRNQKPCRRV